MRADSVEREVKLGSELHLALPDLSTFAERAVRLPVQQLLSTYFDTADFRLWKRSITLRHRTGERVNGGAWTLKLPKDSSGPVLDRVELEWEGPLERLPRQVDDIVRGITRRTPLQKVTSLQTARGRLQLRDDRDRLLAELDDDVVTIHGGPRDGRRFRQIEVELGDGDDDFLQGCVDRLLESGAWMDDRRPKLSRALDLSADDHRVRLSPASVIEDMVRLSIQTGLDRVLDHEYLLRLGPDPSVEAVHQTRVATRRLRSDLQTFRSFLDPVWLAHTRADLKWVGAALGLVRDADVLGANLGLAGGETMGDDKGTLALRRQLDAQRRYRVDRLLDVLKSDRYLDLLDKLQTATERPPYFSSGSHKGPPLLGRKAVDVLPKLVRAPVKKLKKEARWAGDDPTDHQLHDLRIRAKQVRYASELAAPVMGRPFRRIARAAEHLQTQLGEQHDAVVAEEWLRERAKHAPSGAAFVAGELAAAQQHRQDTFRVGWKKQVRRIDRRSRGVLP